jgi:hypothetical protein
MGGWCFYLPCNPEGKTMKVSYVVIDYANRYECYYYGGACPITYPDFLSNGCPRACDYGIIPCFGQISCFDTYPGYCSNNCYYFLGIETREWE